MSLIMLRIQRGKNTHLCLSGMPTMRKFTVTENRSVVPGSGKNGGEERLPMDMGSLPGLN